MLDAGPQNAQHPQETGKHCQDTDRIALSAAEASDAGEGMSADDETDVGGDEDNDDARPLAAE